MSKTNEYEPDIAKGEPFAFSLKSEQYKARYVCVPGCVCDNPACSCRDIGMAVYDYPEQGQELTDSPVYTFVLDLGGRTLQADYNCSRESRAFGEAFLNHVTRKHWTLYEQAFVYLKNRAMEQKKFLKGTAENIAGQILPVSSGNTGRNDPCPCGSGKKYKNCCGK